MDIPLWPNVPEVFWRTDDSTFNFPGWPVSGAGFTFVRRNADATIASSTSNMIDAANVDLTTPAAPADGDEFEIHFPTIRANCTLVPNAGYTVLASGSALPLTSPGSLRRGSVTWKLDGTNWFPKSVNTF